MPFLFYWICGIWFLSELALNRLMRAKNPSVDQKDKNSLKYIWIAIVLGIFIAVALSSTISFPIWNSPAMMNVGLFVIAFGIVLRMIVIYTLGAFFTVDVSIEANHQLKTDGFYSWVRHPSYSASLISFIGLGLALNNWLSLLCILIFVGSTFLYRIKVEEDVLKKFFGNEYEEYRKKTKKLIPFIY